MNWAKIFGINSLIAIVKFSSTFILFGMLARVITPTEYSVVPMAIALFYFCDLICESGVCSFFNQYNVTEHTRKEILKRQTLISFGLYFICLLIGYLIEFYYEIQGQFFYIALSSLVFLLSPSYYIKLGELRREHKFNYIFIIDVISVVTYIIVFLCLMKFNYGVYTLVVSQILMVLMRLVLIQILTVHRESISFTTFEEAKLKLNLAFKSAFNKGLTLNLELYFIPSIMTGADFSMLAQGKKISQVPSDFLSAMVSAPLQTFMKKNVELANKLPLLYLFIGISAMLTLGSSASFLMDIYLGSAWGGASTYLSYYALTMPLLFLYLVYNPFMFSKGKIEKIYKMSKYFLIWTVLTVSVSMLITQFFKINYIHIFPILYSLFVIVILREFYGKDNNAYFIAGVLLYAAPTLTYFLYLESF